uniref:Uncharacterized protein n=1 Tax=Rhizophora mucronata TaxID=61149 RepID=A0A2P2N7N2_RHIMU
MTQNSTGGFDSLLTIHQLPRH